MSSNIRMEKVCQHCGKSFIAKTTVTKYCGDKCANRAYKKRKRMQKIEQAKRLDELPGVNSMEELKTKEFLTVKEVAALLNCSIRSVYYQIENGKIKATNLGERLTRIKRSDIDSLFT